MAGIGDKDLAYANALEILRELTLLVEADNKSLVEAGANRVLQKADRRILLEITDRLRGSGCCTIFIGALATEQPKHLYARLGFHPVMLARAWVRRRAAVAHAAANVGAVAWRIEQAGIDEPP